MDNSKLLAKLYAIKAASKDAAVDGLIDEVKVDIAAESMKGIGKDAAKKTWQTWFARKRKTDRLGAAFIHAKGINNWIFLGDGFVVRTRDVSTFPTTTAYKDEANKALDEILRANKTFSRQWVYLGHRYDIDAELADLKAQKKPQVIEICPGGPVVDGKTLLELSALFADISGVVCRYDPKLGGKSPVYFSRGMTELLLYPIV